MIYLESLVDKWKAVMTESLMQLFVTIKKSKSPLKLSEEVRCCEKVGLPQVQNTGAVDSLIKYGRCLHGKNNNNKSWWGIATHMSNHKPAGMTCIVILALGKQRQEDYCKF